MAKSITNQSSFLAKKTGRVAKNVFYMKTSTPDIIDAYDEPDSDFPNPGHTLEQVFDQEKSGFAPQNSDAFSHGFENWSSTILTRMKTIWTKN